MKRKNKVWALLLSALMMLSLAACGGDDKESAKKVADDTSVMGMSFTAPEEFETVERSIEKSADGNLISKNISYSLSDSRALAFAYTIAEGRSLEEELKDQTGYDRKEYNGTELILYKSGKKTYMAFYQDGEDVYGIQYRASSEETVDDEFDAILQTVRFSKKTETTMNTFTLDNVKYSLELDVPLYSESSNVKENSDGTLVSKSFVWKFANDSEKIDYRFAIEERKNAKLEDALKEDKEYTKEKIGDVTYTFEKGSDDTDIYDHYDYFVQRGDDLYLVQNKGVSNGWVVTRSDESKKAFKTFIHSVKFAK